MDKRRPLTLLIAAALLLAPLAAMADSHEMAAKPITWLSYVKAQTGKGSALGQHMAEGGAKIYDGLMADGHVITWGVGQPINHRAGDDWTHLEWVTFRDWAAVDTFIQGFMAMQMAKSPEQLMEEQEEWYSLVEPGSHYDAILRHQVLHPSDMGRPAYFRLGYHTVKPGQGSAMQELFEENAVPVLSELQAAGTIGGFGLATSEVHGGTRGSHLFWYALPGLAAIDAVDAAFDAAAAGRSEEENKALMGKWMEALEWDAHHDRIIVVTHYGGGGGGEGEGGGDG
jgi:hypothetical protein